MTLAVDSVRFASNVPGGHLIVLTGPTGSGKSATLATLAAAGEQVLDLQALARHRGSAFGGFGLPPQPRHGRFQDAVRTALAGADPARPLWVEECPRYLGSVGLPDDLLDRMAASPWVEVRRDRADRVAAIVAEYGTAAADDWRSAVDRIAGRLGTERTRQVRTALAAGDLPGAVDVLLTYYDHGYGHALPRRTTPPLAVLVPPSRQRPSLG